MHKINTSTVLLAISLGLSGNAMAEGMQKEEYKAADKDISSEYKSAKTGCDALAGNAKDICLAEAKSKEKTARAELELRYKPSSKATYEASLAKAEGDYAVAKAKCDDLGGNSKDVCVKEAKAALVSAKADAKAGMKISKANTKADQVSSDARRQAQDKSTGAMQDAISDKRDADYAVEKEKCASMAGSAKDACMNEAKMHNGK